MLIDRLERRSASCGQFEQARVPEVQVRGEPTVIAYSSFCSSSPPEDVAPIFEAIHVVPSEFSGYRRDPADRTAQRTGATDSAK